MKKHSMLAFTLVLVVFDQESERSYIFCRCPLGSNSQAVTSPCGFMTSSSFSGAGERGPSWP